MKWEKNFEIVSTTRRYANLSIRSYGQKFRLGIVFFYHGEKFGIIVEPKSG